METNHRRRLVINSGGQKFGSQILGGKNFGEIYFQTKNLEKLPSILSKISDDLFLVIDNFFTKCTPFIQNVLRFPFLLPFMFIFLNEENKKFSFDYWGAKKGFCPHPNYWGRVPGLPPRVYAYGVTDRGGLCCPQIGQHSSSLYKLKLMI